MGYKKIYEGLPPRKVNNKYYDYSISFYSRSEANDEKNYYKKEGYNACIIKGKHNNRDTFRVYTN